jgi:hypothetical protein
MHSLLGFLGSLAGLNRATSTAGRPGSPAGTLYICHGRHANDLVYVENLLDFFRDTDVDVETIALSPQNPRSELMRCLHGGAIGVLGMNTQLDHAWIGSRNFLDLAAAANEPVIHWVLDHSSTRWPQFTNATAANSRFLFLSPFSERYFQRYALPGSVTSHTEANTGVSRHSRILRLRPRDFAARSYNCLIALNLRRIGGTLEDAIGRRDSLERKLASAVDQAIDSAYHDLELPIEAHLVAALLDARTTLANDRFNFCLQIVEETVQIRRRQWIFEIARQYPVLIQSDATAAPFATGGWARLETDVDMKTTFTRMKDARAVLNVSHVNDELHNRTINGLNAGCANIVEDNVIHRRLFRDGVNALFFRYDDDSLRRCLDLVCAHPERAYEIGKAGLRLRDRQPVRFGGFDNIIKLARTPLPPGPSLCEDAAAQAAASSEPALAEN